MDLSPEWRLLLACARANPSTEELQRIAQELSGPDLDWDYIAAAACTHGVAPLIYYSLQRSGATRLLPPRAIGTLRNSYYGNAARNSLLYGELGKVLTAFRDNKIAVIVLKGAALAETIYPNRALRPMSDIDLLVKKESLSDVESILFGMGFMLEDRAKGKEFYQQHHYHWVFSKRSGIDVEIHWHIKRPTGPFEIAIDEFWQRAQPIKVAGVEAHILSPEDLLLYLCQHSWKHGLNGGIRPFCDIAEAAKSYATKIDWENVVSAASRWQMSVCAYVGLSLAAELLSAPIPKSFLEDIKPTEFNISIIGWAKERILTHPGNSPFSADVLALFHNGHCVKERVAALGRIVSPSIVAKQYASGSASKRVYLYYPRRITYLLTRYTPLVWQLLSGDSKVKAAAEKEENQLQLTKWLSSH